jgi:EpsI family protein
MKSGARYWPMIAVLLAATTGMAYLSHGEATPPAKQLSEFPTQVAGFKAVSDTPLDQKTIDLLGVTDYLNRSYFSPTQGPVGVYIGYFRSQRTGVTIHSPKNCLPGAGWQPMQSTIYQLPLDDGRKVPINLYILRKDSDEQLVLYWYQAHGRVVASEYWGKFYLVYDALRLNRTDAALVRITTPVLHDDEAQARERAIAFAKQITGDVDQIIPR